jgi:glycosyltransferase involved in cell wall biosynthesis
MALVSHLLPVWNARRDWLLASVRSVLAQDGCELELVVVDDGSEVPVHEVLAEISDRRLRVVRTEHVGVSHARNVAVEQARGDFLRFVDGDDVLPRSSAAQLVAVGRREGALAYGWTTFCDERLRPLWTMRCDVAGDAVEACLLGRFNARLPAILFPRRVVEAIDGWDPAFRVSGDWDYVLRALEVAPVVNVPATVAYYRKHGSSVTARGAGAAAGGALVLDRYLARHPDERGTSLERRARAGVDATAARALLARRRVRDGVAAAARAAAADPRSLLDEAWRAAPALAGHVRGRLRTASASSSE